SLLIFLRPLKLVAPQLPDLARNVFLFPTFFVFGCVDPRRKHRDYLHRAALVCGANSSARRTESCTLPRTARLPHLFAALFETSTTRQEGRNGGGSTLPTLPVCVHRHGQTALAFN